MADPGSEHRARSGLAPGPFAVPDAAGEAPVEKDTVSIHFVREALQVPRQRGVDVAGLLARVGIAPELLDKRSARVSAQHYSALWLAVARAIDDEFFGVDPHPMRQGCFRLMCQAAVGAPRLEPALRRALDFMAAVLDDTRGRLVLQQQQAGIVLESRLRRATPIFAHATFFTMVYGLACWLVNRRIEVLETAFRQSAPAGYAAEYRLLFGQRTRFDAALTRLSFAPDVLALPIRRSQAELRRFLQRSPAAFLVRYRDPASLHARVRRQLQAQPPAEWPTFEELAARFHMAVSTVRRQLLAEGQSYTQIKDALRRDLAIEYLSHSREPVSDIAQKLGFAEASAFHRAFQKWTGESPGAYRQSQRGAALAPHRACAGAADQA